jgi:hypothetical protein
MKTTTLQWMKNSLVAGAAALLAACGDNAPVGPGGEDAAASVAAVATKRANAAHAVDLGACENLRAPAGSKLAFRAYARGVQVYHWTGTSWAFDGPLAVMTADAGGHGVIGTHYAGPTWESNSGGKAVGAVLDRCTPDPNSISWLLLSAVADGPGPFHGVTHIQRVNTVGGNAPSSPGTFTGQEARVSYTTVYLFYRAP